MALEETNTEEQDVKKRPASDHCGTDDAKRAKTGDGEDRTSSEAVTVAETGGDTPKERWRGMCDFYCFFLMRACSLSLRQSSLTFSSSQQKQLISLLKITSGWCTISFILLKVNNSHIKSWHDLDPSLFWRCGIHERLVCLRQACFCTGSNFTRFNHS